MNKQHPLSVTTEAVLNRVFVNSLMTWRNIGYLQH